MAELTRKELVQILAGIPHAACRRPECLVRLAGIDLSGLDLRGLNLAHADMAGADLRGCDLTDARLTGSDLSGADLSHAILRGVFADEATFVDAVMEGVDFRPSDRNLFHGTHLMGADFSGANLSHARLEEADLSGAILEEALLHGAAVRDARMDGATRLTGAGLTARQLETIQWADSPAPASSSEDSNVQADRPPETSGGAPGLLDQLIAALPAALGIPLAARRRAAAA